VFAHFDLPDIPEVSRRTVAAALIVGVAALVAAFSFGYLLVGVGACIGLALGTINYRLVGVSVDKVAAMGTDNPKRPLAANTLGRLGIVTVIALGLALVNKGLGFGVLAGLAVFQFLLIFNVARSMAKAGPGTDHEEVVDGPAVGAHAGPGGIIDSNVVAGRVFEGSIVDSNAVDAAPTAGDVPDDTRGGA
jgi:hypothetical protein